MYPISAPPGYPMSAPPAAYIPAGYPQPGAAVATPRSKSTIIFAALAAIFLVATARLTVLFVTDQKKIADQCKQLTSTSADLTCQVGPTHQGHQGRRGRGQGGGDRHDLRDPGTG